MPRVHLEIDGADRDLVHELRSAAREAGLSLTPHRPTGRIERKSWPPTLEDVQIVLEWAGDDGARHAAKFLTAALAGRPSVRFRIDRRTVAPRERDIFEVLRESLGEEEP